MPRRKYPRSDTNTIERALTYVESTERALHAGVFTHNVVKAGRNSRTLYELLHVGLFHINQRVQPVTYKAHDNREFYPYEFVWRHGTQKILQSVENKNGYVRRHSPCIWIPKFGDSKVDVLVFKRNDKYDLVFAYGDGRQVILSYEHGISSQSLNMQTYSDVKGLFNADECLHLNSWNDNPAVVTLIYQEQRNRKVAEWTMCKEWQCNGELHRLGKPASLEGEVDPATLQFVNEDDMYMRWAIDGKERSEPDIYIKMLTGYEHEHGIEYMSREDKVLAKLEGSLIYNAV